MFPYSQQLLLQHPGLLWAGTGGSVPWQEPGSTSTPFPWSAGSSSSTASKPRCLQSFCPAHSSCPWLGSPQNRGHAILEHPELPLKPPETASFSLADCSVFRLRCSLGKFNPYIIFLHQKVQTMSKLSVFSTKVQMATGDLCHVDKEDIFKCNLEKTHINLIYFTVI